MKNLPWRCGQGQLPVLEFYTPWISPQRLTLETSNFVLMLTTNWFKITHRVLVYRPHKSNSRWLNVKFMRSLSLVKSECSVSGRGRGHMSNFYIVDLENLATASVRYTGDIHNSTVVGFINKLTRTIEATRLHHGWVHMFITQRPTVTVQLHNFDLFRTCHTSSFCTVVWQFSRLQLTRRIAQSLGDSWASCLGCPKCLIALVLNDVDLPYCTSKVEHIVAFTAIFSNICTAHAQKRLFMNFRCKFRHRRSIPLPRFPVRVQNFGDFATFSVDFCILYALCLPQ